MTWPAVDGALGGCLVLGGCFFLLYLRVGR
jgi:hypothetical protein